MSEYRKFTEDGRKYQINGKEYEINFNISGKKLVEWRKTFFSEETTDVLERMKKGEVLAKEITEACQIILSSIPN